MATITREELIEHDGEYITVWRKTKEGTYELEGTLDCRTIECREIFFVEAEDDGCILKTGDEVEVDKIKYQVDLPE